MSADQHNHGDAAQGCLQRALAHLAAARDHARGWQLDSLHRAVADELAHPAMAGDDPLTDALRRQLECCAVEGSQPTTTAGAGLTPKQQADLQTVHADDWWLDLLMPGALAAAALLGFAHQVGWI